MSDSLQQTNLREKFLKIYANLPLSARREIILVFEEQPLTWEVAYLEIKNYTEKSKAILQKLQKLEII